MWDSIVELLQTRPACMSLTRSGRMYRLEREEFAGDQRTSLEQITSEEQLHMEDSRMPGLLQLGEGGDGGTDGREFEGGVSAGSLISVLQEQQRLMVQEQERQWARSATCTAATDGGDA